MTQKVAFIVAELGPDVDPFYVARTWRWPRRNRATSRLPPLRRAASSLVLRSKRKQARSGTAVPPILVELCHMPVEMIADEAESATDVACSWVDRGA
jgi:hypothetical protein